MKRTPLRALVAVLAALAVLAPTSAQAAVIYKYWAYYTVTDGAFAYASKGPGDTKPADGTIEAYRFAAPADFNKPNYPRADLTELTFDAICGDTAAEAGKKRVAVIVDYGVPQDAVDNQATPDPEAGCALVVEDATGIQVLEAAIGDVRTENTSSGPALCGIKGYPATGCFDNTTKVGTPADGEPVAFKLPVSDSAEDAPPGDDDSGNTGLLVGLGAVVVLILGGGLVLQRRRSQS